MGNIIWTRLRKAIAYAFGEQKAETYGGIGLGLFVCGDWVFADMPMLGMSEMGMWIMQHLGAIVIIAKGVLTSSISAIATNTVSYLYKKYVLKIDNNEPPAQTRKRKGKRAA